MRKACSWFVPFWYLLAEREVRVCVRFVVIKQPVNSQVPVNVLVFIAPAGQPCRDGVIMLREAFHFLFAFLLRRCRLSTFCQALSDRQGP